MSSKTSVRFWYPDRQYLAHKEEYDAEIQRVLTNGDLILREDVELFERNLAEFLGVKHVVAVASCTDALVLSLKATGIKPGDEVICPSYTFRATLEAIHHVGAKPVLYDLDGEYKHLVTRKTAAIVPAHLEGSVRRDMADVAEFARNNGLVVIEDAAQSIGAAPVRGSTACYSFYPAKILGCFGDGGAVATNSPHLADHLRKMRNHYKDDWGAGYGYNSRLDNLQAAVLNVKLKYLAGAIAKRKHFAQMYDKGLTGVGLPEEREVYQDYIVVTPEAEGLIAHLAENGVQAMANEYPFPDGLKKKPLTAEYERNTVRLPCTPEHTEEEIQAVIKAVNSYEG